MGIKILPPDVNKSFARFTVEGEAIRYGLLGIKNVGEKAIESIIEARRRDGTFGSLAAFCERVDSRLVNRKVMESLIKCGVFDGLGLARSQLLAILNRAMELGSMRQKEKQGGQLSFFDLFGRSGAGKGEQQEIPSLEEWPESQLLAFEKELLGFYLTGHPLSRYEPLLKLYDSTTTAGLAACPEGAQVTLGGVITRLKVTTTKKGNERMAILSLEDFQGSVEVLVFPKVFTKAEVHLKLDSVVLATGRVSNREDRPKLLAQEVIPLEQALSQRVGGLHIRLSHPVERKTLQAVRELLRSHPGEVPIELTLGNGANGGIRIEVGSNLRVSPSPDLLDALIKLVGDKAITIRKA